MPHSTSHSISTGSHMRAASQTRASTVNKSFSDSNSGGSGIGETEKFPDFDPGQTSFLSAQPPGQQRQNGFPSGNGDSYSGRWHPRRDSRVKWGLREAASGSSNHTKTNSITSAVHRMRSASMSHNAHEIAEALRAPISWKLIVCFRGSSRERQLTTTSKC